MATSQRGRTARQLIAHAVIRMSVVTAVLFCLYAWAPLGQRPERSAHVWLVLSLPLA